MADGMSMGGAAAAGKTEEPSPCLAIDNLEEALYTFYMSALIKSDDVEGDMPKIIPELREKLLLCARKRLAEDESHDFSTRQLASDCGIAAGTVFNYFPTKESLLATIMLEDWRVSLERMRDVAEHARTLETGLTELERSLRAFSRPFLPVWRRYDRLKPLPEYHSKLIRQLCGPLEALLRKFEIRCGETELVVLAELLLASSQREEGTIGKLIPIMEKIVM